MRLSEFCDTVVLGLMCTSVCFRAYDERMGKSVAIDLIAISEAAVLLGRSKQYVWNAALDGRLPHATASGLRGAHASRRARPGKTGSDGRGIAPAKAACASRS